MLTGGVTILELVLAKFLERQESFVLPGQQHVAHAALDEGGGGAARPGIEHRHVPEQRGDELAGLLLVAARLFQDVSPGRQIVPARAAGSLGIRRDHDDAGLDQVGPVVDALGIALAHQEHDGGGVGRAVVAGAGSASWRAAAWRVLAIASMSYAKARVTTSASSPSMTARACLPEPPWDISTVNSPPPSSFQCLAKAAL